MSIPASRLFRWCVIVVMLVTIVAPLSATGIAPSPVSAQSEEENGGAGEDPVGETPPATNPESPSAPADQDSSTTNSGQTDEPVADPSTEPDATSSDASLGPATQNAGASTQPSGNTPAGSNVDVTGLGDGTISVQYESVLAEGQTDAQIIPAETLPAALESESAVSFEITTTAEFAGSVSVCVALTGIAAADDAVVLVMNDGAWTELSTRIDAASGRLCADWTTLGRFAIAVPLAEETTVHAAAETGSISVLVQGTGGVPAEFAQIGLYTTDTSCEEASDFLTDAYTDSTGSYLFDDLPTGQYCVWLNGSPPGFADVDVGFHSIIVTQGVVTPAIFTFATYPTPPDNGIWGLVRLELRSLGGSPLHVIGGTDSCVVLSEPQLHDKSIVCDTDHFSGESGQPDSIIDIYVEAGSTATIDSYTPPLMWVLADGETLPSLAVDAGERLTYTLAHDYSGTGALSVYSGVSGATFDIFSVPASCDDDRDLVDSVTTGDHGFVHTELLPGIYCVVHAHGPEGYTLLSAPQQEVAIYTAQFSGVEFEFEPPPPPPTSGSLEISVRGGDGMPSRNTRVEIWVEYNGDCSFLAWEYVSGFTGADGTFLASDLPGWSFCVLVSDPPPGYGDIDQDRQPALVELGETVQLTFTFATFPPAPDPETYGLVEIELVDLDGNRVIAGNSCIHLSTAQIGDQAIVCDSDHYTGQFAPDGLIEIWVIAENPPENIGFYADLWSLASGYELPSLAIEAGETVRRQLVVEPNGNGLLVLTVDTSFGSPVQGASFDIRLSDNCLDTDDIATNLQTDASGRAAYSLSPGSYCAIFSSAPDGYGDISQERFPFEITELDTTYAEFTFYTSPPSLRIYAQAADGRPAPNAYFEVTTAADPSCQGGGDYRGGGTTNDDGNLLIGGLDPGDYCVYLYGSGSGFGDPDEWVKPVTVEAGTPGEVTFTFNVYPPPPPDPEIYGLVRLEVRDPDGNFIDGLDSCVAIDPPQIDDITVICDSDHYTGEYQFPDGRIDVYVTADGASLLWYSPPVMYETAEPEALPTELIAEPGTQTTHTINVEPTGQGAVLIDASASMSSAPGTIVDITEGNACLDSDTVVATITTEGDPPRGLAVLDPGTYCAIHIEAPPGYGDPQDERIPFTITASVIRYVTFWYQTEPPLPEPDMTTHGRIFVDLVGPDGQRLPVAAAGLNSCLQAFSLDENGNYWNWNSVCDSLNLAASPGIDGRIVFYTSSPNSVSYEPDLFVPPSGYTLVSDLPALMTAAPGETVTYEIELALDTEPSFLALEIVDEIGNPFPGLSFSVNGGNDTPDDADGANDGFVHFHGSTYGPGEYTVTVNDYYARLLGLGVFSHSFEITSAGGLHTEKITLRPSLVISLEFDGVLGNPGVSVCTQLADEELHAIDVCDDPATGAADGILTYYNLLPGNYHVMALFPVGFSGPPEGSIPVTITDGQTTQLTISLTSRDDGALRVDLVDGNDDPLSGGCFSAGQGTVCDGDDGSLDGSTMLYNIGSTVDLYQERAPHGYRIATSRSVTIENTPEIVSVVNETATPSATVLLVDEEGTPLTGGLLQYGNDFNSWYAWDTDDGAADGVFTLYDLEPGAYWLYGIFNSQSATLNNVDIPAVNPISLVIDQPFGQPVFVVDLVDVSGAPAPGGCVLLAELGGQQRFRACDDDGDGAITLRRELQPENATYRVTETKAPAGFPLASSQTVVLGSTRPMVVTLVHGVNTGVGVDQTVTPLGVDGATISFSEVLDPGLTTIQIIGPTQLPMLPDGALFSLGDATYYDIRTTANYDGTITVCLPSSNPLDRLLHFDGSAWVDVTSTGYPDAGTICGIVENLSPFGVVPLLDDGGDDGNTPAGSNVLVEGLGDGSISVLYSTVTESGDTTATELEEYPDPDWGHGLYSNPFVISTDAVFTGQVEICYTFESTPYSPEILRMLQLGEDDAWVEIPATVDSSGESVVICGTANTLDLPFAIAQALTTLEVYAFAYPGGPPLISEPFDLYDNAACTGSSISTWYTQLDGRIELYGTLVGDYCFRHDESGQTHSFTSTVAGSVQTWTFYASPYNTEPGSGVVVESVSGLPITVTFSGTVTDGGLTTASAITDPFSAPWGPIDIGYPLDYETALGYAISTTASFTGTVEICVTYDPADFNQYGSVVIAVWDMHGNGSESWNYSNEASYPAQTTLCGYDSDHLAGVLLIQQFGGSIGLQIAGAPVPSDPSGAACATFHHVADASIPDIAVCDGDSNDIDGELNGEFAVRPPFGMYEITAYTPPAGYQPRFDPVGTQMGVFGNGDNWLSIEHDAINTPASDQPVIVTPQGAPAGSSITFPNVTTPGVTSVQQLDQETIEQLPALPSGLYEVGGLFFDITTTASFDGVATLCLSYDPGYFENPEELALLHYDGDAWVEITTSNDAVNGLICGETDHFSPFAIVEKLDDDPTGPTEPTEPTEPTNPGKPGKPEGSKPGGDIGSIDQLPNTGAGSSTGIDLASGPSFWMALLILLLMATTFALRRGKSSRPRHV